MLSVEHVTKTYGKFTALEDISLTFIPGVYGLLAPNGAGKTTLIKMLTTLLFPTKGQILWEGEDIRALGAEYRGLLGYLPQQFGYYPSYTPRQFLRYAAALQCIPKREADGRIDHLLETVGLGDAADKKMKKFSGGMLQRVGIAVAMLNDPKLLILDEPTAGLDPRERVRFRNLIHTLAEDRIVILSTHIVSDLRPSPGKSSCSRITASTAATALPASAPGSRAGYSSFLPGCHWPRDSSCSAKDRGRMARCSGCSARRPLSMERR